jgi:TPR repeat/Tetratricopeptide repeat
MPARCPAPRERARLRVHGEDPHRVRTGEPTRRELRSEIGRGVLLRRVGCRCGRTAAGQARCVDGLAQRCLRVVYDGSVTGGNERGDVLRWGHPSGAADLSQLRPDSLGAGYHRGRERGVYGRDLCGPQRRRGARAVYPAPHPAPHPAPDRRGIRWHSGGIGVVCGAQHKHALATRPGGVEKQVTSDDGAEIGAAQAAVELNQANADAWNTLGVALGHAARYEEALAAYCRATELDPVDALAWNNQGTTLAILKRYEEAVTAYRHAIARDATLAAPWINLGANLALLERFDEAITAYQRGISLDAADTDAWYNLGVTLHQLGRDEEALNAYCSHSRRLAALTGR